MYSCPAEQLAAAAAYIAGGLDAGERCLYVLTDRSLVEVVDALHDAGIDVPRHAAMGSLQILRAEQTYLRSGAFEPEVMIDLLRARVTAARVDGYVAVRAAGEMGWALDPRVRLADVQHYEERLNRTVFAEGRLTGLCLYDVRRLDRDTLRALASAHPVIMPAGRASADQSGGPSFA